MKTSNKPKIALITGPDSGIGLATAMLLASKGYQLGLICRTKEKGQKALDQINTLNPNGHRLFVADLSETEQIFNLAEVLHQHYSYVDLIINNAGVFSLTKKLTSDGSELTFAVNVRAPFMLINLTLDLLNYSDAGFILNISSGFHKRGVFHWTDFDGRNRKYDGMATYADSKLALTTFTYELGRRLAKHELTIGSMHPGVIRTSIARDYANAGFFMKMALSIGNAFMASPETAAKSIFKIITDPTVKNKKGFYADKGTLAEPLPISLLPENGKQLWNWLSKSSGLVTMI
jgi:NAD(P)-dependent dehydrogenase (short-subunit alcohol dehydrogenase family)